MADVGELLRRLIDDVEHAESLGLQVVAIDDVLPVLRGYDRTTILNANVALSLSDIPMILAFGLLSDHVGRRMMFLTGMAGLALFAVPYFMLVSTSNIWLFMLGSLIVQACRCAVYGPQSAYFAEQFSTRMRYSGCSLAYQFAAILGGMAPLICTALVAMTGSLYSVAAFVIVIALVSLTCSYLMTETLRSGLRRDDILSDLALEGAQ